jgi:hypothetical protein
MSATERAPAQAALDEQIRDFIARASATWSADPAELDRLLVQVFAHQVRWNAAYARFAARRGAGPDRVATACEIPPVPARAFTRLRMATFPPAETVRRFRSSGTTGGPRAVLELDSGQLSLYEAALLPPFVRFLLPDRRDLAWVALLPAPAEALESSLAAMVGSAARQLGAEVDYFVTAPGELDARGVRVALEQHAERATPVLLLGTSLALDALCTALRAESSRLLLAPGSRVMETGGYKGRRTTVEPGALAQEIAVRLGVPHLAVIAEYGMTEMTSQFYDPAWHEQVTSPPTASNLDVPLLRRLVGPPWVRTRIVDPVSLTELPAGEEGLLLHLDPTARSSAVALLTEDLGIQHPDGIGFELRGRMPGAEARGCSLALDDLLRAGADQIGDRHSGAARSGRA